MRRAASRALFAAACAFAAASAARWASASAAAAACSALSACDAVHRACASLRMAPLRRPSAMTGGGGSPSARASARLKRWGVGLSGPAGGIDAVVPLPPPPTDAVLADLASWADAGHNHETGDCVVKNSRTSPLCIGMRCRVRLAARGALTSTAVRQRGTHPAIIAPVMRLASMPLTPHAANAHHSVTDTRQSPQHSDATGHTSTFVCCRRVARHVGAPPGGVGVLLLPA